MIKQFEKVAVSGAFLSDLAVGGALKRILGRMGYDHETLSHETRKKLVKMLKDHMYNKDVVFLSAKREYSPLRKRLLVKHRTNKDSLDKWNGIVASLPRDHDVRRYTSHLDSARTSANA